MTCDHRENAQVLNNSVYLRQRIIIVLTRSSWYFSFAFRDVTAVVPFRGIVPDYWHIIELGVNKTQLELTLATLSADKFKEFKRRLHSISVCNKHFKLRCLHGFMLNLIIDSMSDSLMTNSLGDSIVIAIQRYHRIFRASVRTPNLRSLWCSEGQIWFETLIFSLAANMLICMMHTPFAFTFWSRYWLSGKLYPAFRRLLSSKPDRKTRYGCFAASCPYSSWTGLWFASLLQSRGSFDHPETALQREYRIHAYTFGIESFWWHLLFHDNRLTFICPFCRIVTG